MKRKELQSSTCSSQADYVKRYMYVLVTVVFSRSDQTRVGLSLRNSCYPFHAGFFFQFNSLFPKAMRLIGEYINIFTYSP